MRTIFFCAIFLFGNFEYSFAKRDHAPAFQTGMIGEPSCGFNDNPTNTCHANPNCGTSVSTLSTFNFDLILTANGEEVDENFKYNPSELYNMVFKIINPSSRSGFSLTAVDNDGNYSGVITPTGTESELSEDDIHYVGHTNTLGVNEWTFNWKAPAAGTGKVNFFATANKGSNDIPDPEPCLDLIIPFKIGIEENLNVSIDENSVKNEVSVLNNPILNDILALRFFTQIQRTFYIEIYSLSGKIILSKKMDLHLGIQNIEFPLTEKGVLIVNLINEKNEFASYKILNK